MTALASGRPGANFVDGRSAHIFQLGYQLVAEASDEPDGVWIAGERTDVDQIDAQRDVVFDSFQVSIKVLERVDKQAHSLSDLGGISAHRLAMPGQHIAAKTVVKDCYSSPSGL